MHPLKYLFVILVGGGIFLQSFSKMIILVNFQINNDYISKNLCVKKEVKNNCCKGSCHLKKQLQEEEKKEQSPASSLKNVKEFQIFCQYNSSFKFQSSLLLETDFTPFKGLTAFQPSFSIFHPPKV